MYSCSASGECTSRTSASPFSPSSSASPEPTAIVFTEHPDSALESREQLVEQARVLSAGRGSENHPPVSASGDPTAMSRRHRRPRSTAPPGARAERRRRAPHAATRRSPLHREVVARHRCESCLKARRGERRQQRLGRRPRGRVEGKLERLVDHRHPVQVLRTRLPRAPRARRRPLRSPLRPRRPDAIPPAPRARAAGCSRRRASGAPAGAATPFRADAMRFACPSRSSTPRCRVGCRGRRPGPARAARGARARRVLRPGRRERSGRSSVRFATSSR